MITITRISNLQGHLVFELFNRYRVFYGQLSDIDLAKRFVQERLDNDESIIIAALLPDKRTAVGFTQLYPKHSSARAVRNWVLNDLFVERAYRKRGVGTQLIQAATAFAKANRAEFVELSTATDNGDAQRLYEQIGFERRQPETDFYTYRLPIIYESDDQFHSAHPIGK